MKKLSILTSALIGSVLLTVAGNALANALADRGNIINGESWICQSECGVEFYSDGSYGVSDVRGGWAVLY